MAYWHMLSNCRMHSHRRRMGTKKEGVILGLKGIYPDYYKSDIFTQWVINLDKLETI